MFSTNTHYQLHIARQKELEAEAQKYRLCAKIAGENNKGLRKRIGTSLIVLGKKLAQEPDIQLTFSSAQG